MQSVPAGRWTGEELADFDTPLPRWGAFRAPESGRVTQSQMLQTPAWLVLPAPRSNHSGYTLSEVGEAIRRLGLRQGYEVIAEMPVRVDRNSSHPSKIDWVWRKDGGVEVAFEIEGSNALDGSIKADIRKFAAVPEAQQHIILTYDVRYTPGGWTTLSDKKDRIKILLRATPTIRLMSAREFVENCDAANPGGIAAQCLVVL